MYSNFFLLIVNNILTRLVHKLRPHIFKLGNKKCKTKMLFFLILTMLPNFYLAKTAKSSHSSRM